MKCMAFAFDQRCTNTAKWVVEHDIARAVACEEHVQGFLSDVTDNKLTFIKKEGYHGHVLAVGQYRGNAFVTVEIKGPVELAPKAQIVLKEVKQT